MILTLSFVIIGLLVLLYILALALDWRSGERAMPEMTIEQITVVGNTIERNMRKSVYLAFRLWYSAKEYSSTKIRSLFLKVFPNAVRALKKHDILTGLSSGPSSYFLSEITLEKRPEKIRRKRKSM